MIPQPCLELVTVEYEMPFSEMICRAGIGRVHSALNPERMRSWLTETRRLAVGAVRPRSRLWHRDLWKIQPDRMSFLDLWELLAYVATLTEFRPRSRFVGARAPCLIGGLRLQAVPVVEDVDGVRFLNLQPIKYGWTPGYAFPVSGDPRLIAPELLSNA